jgi:GNAT superfamily N-acetyltransferase
MTELSDQAMADAIELNWYAMTPFSHGWPNTERYQSEEISWCLTGIPVPHCNPVFRARLTPEKVDKTIEYLAAKARQRNVPLLWYVAPGSQPDDLGKHLLDHGFVTHGGTTGMAIDLQEIKKNEHQPDDLIISEVKDSETLKTWCQVGCTGFGIPERAAGAVFQWFSKDVEHKIPVKFYLGRVNGKVVATSAVLFAEGVAGIYWVATLPKMRNRGIGFAVTEKPLLVAREMGYRAGILQASTMGAPVYRRMGFKEYSHLNTYMLTLKPK